MSATSLTEWAGVCRWRCRERSPELPLGSGAPVLTEWDEGEESTAYLALNPPSRPALLLSLFLSVSLSRLILLCLLSAPAQLPPSPSCTKWIPTSASSRINASRATRAIPAGEWQIKRQTWLEARYLWVYLYGTEGVSALRAAPTPILSETSSYWIVPEGDQQQTWG